MDEELFNILRDAEAPFDPEMARASEIIDRDVANFHARDQAARPQAHIAIDRASADLQDGVHARMREPSPVHEGAGRAPRQAAFPHQRRVEPYARPGPVAPRVPEALNYGPPRLNPVPEDIRQRVEERDSNSTLIDVAKDYNYNMSVTADETHDRIIEVPVVRRGTRYYVYKDRDFSVQVGGDPYRWDRWRYIRRGLGNNGAGWESIQTGRSITGNDVIRPRQPGGDYIITLGRRL